MSKALFHPLAIRDGYEELPRQFTYPFCYTPHPLCLQAADEVRTFVASHPALHALANDGKMFGVLVAQDTAGRIGFLAAYSGSNDGIDDAGYFAPPIYDLTSPDGFFKTWERRISKANKLIDRMQRYLSESGCTEHLRRTEEQAQADEAAAKEAYLAEKKRRDQLRKGTLTEEQRAKLVRESQFQKAELKRMRQAHDQRLSAAREEVARIQRRIAALKAWRKKTSAQVQENIFRAFVVNNALGERRSVWEIFEATESKLPPSGTGECAAPKLLQHAYVHHLHPLVMAEFWMGRSPKTELRTQGRFYPACQGKCGPLLGFMLRGLNVEANPLLASAISAPPPELIYEDDTLLVYNKPAGLLSVPGKLAALSLDDYARRISPDMQGAGVVHRLDMDTSGLMVVARNPVSFQKLRRQFESRLVTKHYQAILDGTVARDSGTITLPLSPDWNDRPRQKVDFECGKESVTRYEVLERKNGRTKVLFIPSTGRTHQLRVHAAHPDGLGCPIHGDKLYGTPADRLYLHACHIEFEHPATGEKMEFDAPPAWE